MFLFRNTKSLLSELGAASSHGRLGELFLQEKCASILLVTDKGVRDAGLIQGAVKNLNSYGIKVTIFDKVEADPSESIIQEAVQSAGNDIDGVLGFGGGSSLDVAKVVAFLKGNTNQTLSDLYGVDQCEGERLPLIQVPTTAGTGSEVTPISIITTGANSKMGIVSRQLYPDVAVLDGNLTITVPSSVTAATGIDAMVHAIEARTSRVQKNPLSDMLAHEALRLLSSNIRQVCLDGRDGRARGEMLLGSCLAGMAFANAPVAAVHALAYPLGSHFKIPHGLSNALVLPHVLRFNNQHPDAAREYDQISDICHFERTSSCSLADGMHLLAMELDVPTTLSEVGVCASDVEMLSTEAMKQQRLLPNNPVEVTLADCRSMYNLAL